ncbi:ribonuclease P protein component [Salinisphaera sp. T31B1]|uniref:ribonuclease P protein component n=1 Tax=Salinisphaera sp. T31B1 TaxID=727963 RepID=UPI00333EC26B
MTQAAFPKTARLRNAGDFRAVFKHGSKKVSAGFVVIFAPGSAMRARLGLALAKRRIARSVDRNRVKRVLRESFRCHQQGLGNVDIVVLARSRTASMSNAELFAQLATIWPSIARSGGLSHGDRSPPAGAGQR